MVSTSTAPAVVLREQRSQRDLLFGFLVIVFVAAAARGLLSGTNDTDDKVAAGVLAVLAVLTAALWLYLALHPRTILVSPDLIRLDQRGARQLLPQLTRTDGTQLLFVLAGPRRARYVELTSTTSGARLPLQFFDLGEVRRACLARGWRFAEPATLETLLDVLDETAKRVSGAKQDPAGSSFVSLQLLVDDLRSHREWIERDGAIAPDDLRRLFQPAGPVQEVAMANGWADRFIELAARVEATLDQIAPP